MGYITFGKSSLSMFNLLDRFPKSQATEPRDYVYALLGIPDYRLPGCDIPVYYSKAVGEVFQDATQYCFTQDQLWVLFVYQ